MTYSKQVIICRLDIKLPKGKLGAQVAHASGGAIKSLMTEEAGKWTLTIPHGSALDDWWNNSWTKAVLAVENEEQLHLIVDQAKARGLPTSVVVDNGTTIYHGVPTVTCAAIGPAWSNEFDGLTDHLKLFPGK